MSGPVFVDARAKKVNFKCARGDFGPEYIHRIHPFRIEHRILRGANFLNDQTTSVKK